MRARRIADPDAVRKQYKRWLEANPGYVERYQAENAERYNDHARVSAARRRAKRHGSLIADDRKGIAAFYAAVHSDNPPPCLYCQTIFDETGRWPWGSAPPAGDREVNHKIPLARGGTHSLENLTAACRTCNRRKNNRSVDAFLDWLRAVVTEVGESRAA